MALTNKLRGLALIREKLAGLLEGVGIFLFLE
jgi:hypothetical protein